MIPVLFEETAFEFDNMGICSLSLATKAIVKRVLNGKDELELTYPVNGQYFRELKNSRIIVVQPEYQKPVQPYRIYRISKPMKGLVTVYARHISEQRAYLIVEPFAASNITSALEILPTKIVGQHHFTFWSDKTTVARYERVAPSTLGGVLGGEEGSFLDVFGGEYEFDGYQVKIWGRRGIDRGVSIEYAKNMTALEVTQAVDETVVTSLCPIWRGGGMDENDPEVCVYLPEIIIDSEYVSAYPYRRTMIKDFSDQFQAQPTEEELRSVANEYMSSVSLGVPSISIKVSFAHLAQFEEYKNYSVLETLNLGDTVLIHHADLDVDIQARVIETTYNVLTESYSDVIVGKMQSNMTTTLAKIDESINQKAKTAGKTFLHEAITNVTNKITGVNGGYVVTNLDADGNPYEVLIMDSPEKMTAVNVLRINQNGIGFSKTGYNGPFNTAWTIDGEFVADTIDGRAIRSNSILTQRLTATDLIIKGGSIEIETNDENYDLLDLKYASASGFLRTKILPGSVQVSRDESSVHVDSDGIRFMTGDKITGWLPAAGIKFVDIDLSALGRLAYQPYRQAVCDKLNEINDEISVNSLIILRVKSLTHYSSVDSDFVEYNIWGLFKNSEDIISWHYDGGSQSDPYTDYFPTGYGSVLIGAEYGSIYYSKRIWNLDMIIKEYD